MSRALLRGLAATSSLALLALGGPALAHVTVDPGTAEGGGYTKVTLRVPNESEKASTTKVQLFLPADHPFGSVSVQPVPGWTYRVVETRLRTPITTDDGQVSRAVSQITWSAASPSTVIRPGQFDEFSVALGPLPDAGSIVLKVLQTYSDGEVARWIQPPVDGQPEPEHPAPVVTLTGADTGDAADASDDGDARATWALGLSALAVLIAAGGALGLRGKRP